MEIECALLELHHWDYPTLNATDADDIMNYMSYYPQWRKRMAEQGGAEQADVRDVYANEMRF